MMHEQHRHGAAAHARAKDLLDGYARGGDVDSQHHKSPASDKVEDARMVRHAMAEHDSQLHPGKHTRLKLAHGGAAEGEKSRRRLDRGGRSGGHGKSKASHVNVIVAPNGGGGEGGARPVPVPVPAAGGAPMPPPMPPPGMPPGGMPPGGPPRPMMPPPGAVPGGVPGMPPPGLRSRGGRAGHKDGGRTKKQMGGPMPGAVGAGMPMRRPMVAPGRGAPMAPQGLARPMMRPNVAAMPAGVMRKEGGRAKHAEGGRIQEAAEAHAKEEPKMPHMEAGARSAIGRLEKEKAFGGCEDANAGRD